ncbi:selenoprotein K [Salpingoeca rosetta]|uniref:Selenoprotein K n=1 Tax=Salpingoeca rosetta (strain ATCC 50818 / BSB-021) TaxID=946362 RepID=F2U291_SALR5|nr:selenoprotein K [Salpingoeca rosetta]EGD81743.1 selenoprotein K [Salpingoeca rosetta]|eukprot:XP_004996947.1 selenoprotein K [Salpingoeca rosetta]
MVYIQNSQVHQRRSWLRLSIFSDIFWGIINFFYLFFSTLIQPNKFANGYTETDYRRGGGGRGPGDDDSGGYPRRRMGGFRRNNGPAPPPMGGG